MQAVGDTTERAKQIEWDSQLSIRRQCELLHIHRSKLYYQPVGHTKENEELMPLIDQFHLEDPAAGTRRMSKYLCRSTVQQIGRKRVRRLMHLMGIEAIFPRKGTTIPGGPSGIFPYRLRGLKITRPNQVWSVDITYVPMRRGFMYLFAIIDWYSRKIICWELSTTLDTVFCLRCLKLALTTHESPEIINSDQGCQFTSSEWIKCLQSAGITISMDGKGRWLDNVAHGIKAYILRYNGHRPHVSLANATPDEMYYEKLKKAA